MRNLVAIVAFAGLSAVVPAAGNQMAAEGPDGTEWQDVERLSFGCEKPRAAFVPFPNERLALKILPEFSDRQVSLNSTARNEWRFNWAKDPASRPKGFQDPGYDVSAWPAIRVPCSWQAMGASARGGWGTPLYVNSTYPFARNAPRVMDEPPKDFTSFAARNPVGSYRRDFRLPTGWIGDVENEPVNDIFLKFDGVDSFFYLWVNGRYVGFSKDSRSPAEFNVTKHVHPGVNTVALEVYRYSDGSYLEDQNAFRLSGIFRNTWLIRRAKKRVNDFFVKTYPAVPGAWTGDWEVEVEIEGNSDEPVDVAIFTWDDIPIAHGRSRRFEIRRPKLWSAEDPNCYKIVLGCGGEYLSAVFGFRVSEIANGRYRLNGQKIKLKGANRHETHPLYGHYVPRATQELDVAELKAANCNCVRNSHYPQDDYWYYLCNVKGLYLVDEANVESHGYGHGRDSLSHRREWAKATVARNLAMVERNKNHPSVIIWSHGNEAGPGENFQQTALVVKERDPSRPTHYASDCSVADMDACRHPSVDEVWRKARDVKSKKPFYISESAHGRGNAMGGLKDCQDAIESSDVILGATIGDWVDQGLYRWKEGRRIIAYGGDFGDRPNDGPFAMNGCVLSDRTREPGFYEIQHVYQNWSACASNDCRAVVVRNKNYFLTSRDVQATWQVIRNGVPTVRGRFDISGLGPQESRVFPLPQEAIENYRLGGDVSLRIVFYKLGRQIADDQIDLPVRGRPALEPSGGPAAAGGDAAMLTLAAEGVTYGFCRKTGALKSIRVGGRFGRREWLANRLRLDAFRAPCSNEAGLGEKWMRLGLHNLASELVSFSEPRVEAGETVFTVETSWFGAESVALRGYRSCETRLERADRIEGGVRFRMVQTWHARRDGTLVCRCTITPRGKACELARIGLSATLAASNPAVEWFGAGPEENYRDRMSGAFLGHYRLNADDFFFPYARPEDCGNRENTRSVVLIRGEDQLTVQTGGEPFAFAVNPYRATALVTCNHPAELPPSNTTELGIYAATRGLGGASRGSEPLERDIIRADRPYHLDLIIRPGVHFTGVHLANRAARTGN